MLWTLSAQAEAYREGRGRMLANEAYRKDTKNPKAEVNDYQLDMKCFNLCAWGSAMKHHFLLRAMSHQWGERLKLSETVNGKRFVNYWAGRMAQEFCRSTIIDLMGCGSSGKTHFATCYGYTLWKSVPFNTSVYLSTTTGEGADARAWAVIQAIFRDDKAMRIGKLINSTRTLVVEEVSEDDAKHRDLRNAVKCVLIPTGNEGRNVVAAISGRKNARVAWICDELPHLDPGVLSGRINLLTNVSGGGRAQFIGCGNGPKEGDAMYLDAEPENGWDSINKDEHWRWVTNSGVCLYFNGDKSPNMQVERGEKTLFPGLMDWTVRDEMLKACWNDEMAPEFWTQFFGFPPSVKVNVTVLNKPFMQGNGAFENVEWAGVGQKTLAGLDLGFKADGDPTCIHFGEVGRAVDGRMLLNADEDGEVVNPSAAVKKEDFEKQVAEKVVARCRDRSCHDLAIDITGDGGILLQAIEKEARAKGWQLNCIAVSFGGTPDDRIPVPGDKRKASQVYDRRVSQLWGQCRAAVGRKAVRGLREKGKATQQLCQRKFATDEKKRFTVESKKDMKKRIKRSPDHGDAFALLVHCAMKNGLADTEEAPKPPTPPWVPKPAAEHRAQYASGHATRSIYTGWGK